MEAERSKSDLEPVPSTSFTLCWSRQGDHKVEPKIRVLIFAVGDKVNRGGQQGASWSLSLWYMVVKGNLGACELAGGQTPGCYYSVLGISSITCSL